MLEGSLGIAVSQHGTIANGSRLPDGAAETSPPFAFPRPTDDAVSKASILVVDDECSVVKVVSRHLRDAGFVNVQTQTNSAEVVASVHASPPDLVLLDLRMQPTSGLEILKTIRDDERTAHIPVVVLTSDSSEDIETTALNLGANDFITKPLRVSQFSARIRNILSAKIYRDLVTDYSMQLESDVLRDALTGIANRRAFEYEIKRRFSEWKGQQTPLGLLMVDLDHFKKTNDLYGHPVGDEALRHVAKVLETATRKTDLIARYDGEEFAIILPAATVRESKEAAERIRQTIQADGFSVEDQPMPLTISVGVANAMPGDDAILLVRRADIALCSAKQNGRNCCFFHDGAACVELTRSGETGLRHESGAIQHVNQAAPIEAARIAIVDDEAWTIAVVKKHLKDAGYESFIEITEATKALETIRKEEPDIVLLDVRMPQVNGLDVLKELRRGGTASDVPVLIFTSSSDKATKVTALELGASDFLEKPVDASELLARVRNTLLAKSHMDSLAHYSSRLEHEVCVRTTELVFSRRQALECLARAGELKDDQTGRHVLRVGRYSAVVADELGFGEDRVLWIEHAAQLHDVGKIGVPDAILHKPGKLTDDEWDVMKAHCLAGTKILLDDSAIQNQSSDEHVGFGMDVFQGCNSPIMRLASVVTQTHHEKWDGSGYPRGLAGTAIPIEGRIAAVADVFDALSTKRPYKDAYPLEKCFRIMEDSRGSHFDPDVLDAFFRRKSDVIRTFHDYAD